MYLLVLVTHLMHHDARADVTARTRMHNFEDSHRVYYADDTLTITTCT